MTGERPKKEEFGAAEKDLRGSRKRLRAKSSGHGCDHREFDLISPSEIIIEAGSAMDRGGAGV